MNCTIKHWSCILTLSRYLPYHYYPETIFDTPLLKPPLIVKWIVGTFVLSIIVIVQKFKFTNLQTQYDFNVCIS